MEFPVRRSVAILKPRRTIKEIIASDMESIPSAVATTLPLRNPVISSTIPIPISVITENFAILCPANIPSSTRFVAWSGERTEFH